MKGRRSRGPKSTQSQSEHVRERDFKWSAHRATRGFTRRLWSSSDELINEEDRTNLIDREIDASWDRGLTDACNRDRPTNLEQIGRLAFFRGEIPRDCGSIAMRSWPFLVRSWLILGAIVPWSSRIDGPRSSCDRGHQFHLSTGSNGPICSRGNPFKTDAFSLLFS